MVKMVVANWKMNGSIELAKELTAAMKLKSYECDIKMVVCPPFVLIPYVEGRLRHNTDIGIGAQDVSTHESGAYTGEVSATMLREVGCKYVIIGHSERRAYHSETTAIVIEKIEQAIQAGLTPIVCIGESLEDRKAGNTDKFLASQLDPILGKFKEGFILAYEPVWAIGTGLAATLKEIKETHGFLKKKLYNCPIPLLYGGSVNAGNALAILSCKDVDGVLVGGASLKMSDLNEICQAAHEAGI